MKLKPIERRVLAYLDQRGATHRERAVVDLAGPDSKIAYRGGNIRGSNGATPLIMGAWCRRLKKEGLVREVRSGRPDYHYRHHEITSAGRKALRSDAE